MPFSLTAVPLMVALAMAGPTADAQSGGRPLSLVEALSLAEKKTRRKASSIIWVAEDGIPAYHVEFRDAKGEEIVIIHAMTGDILDRERESIADLKRELGLASRPTSRRVDLAGAIKLVQQRRTGWVFEAERVEEFGEHPVYSVRQRFRSGVVNNLVDGWGGRIVQAEREDEDEDEDDYEDDDDDDDYDDDDEDDDWDDDDD